MNDYVAFDINNPIEIRRDEYVDRTRELYGILLTWETLGLLKTNSSSNGIVIPNELDLIIIKLLGFKDPIDLLDNWDATRADKLSAMLDGPHGWVIYKAILVRQDA